MKGIIVIIVIILLCSYTLEKTVVDQHTNKLVQDKVEDKLLLWSSSIKLEWIDFQGVSDTKSMYKALTYVQIGLKSKQFDDKIVVDIPTYFYKNLSWSKRKKNNSLLKHEQVHFDIGELMARNIRREFSLYVHKDPESIYKDLKGIYRKYFGSEFDRYNKNYDKETEHGTIKAKQKEWELKIAKELKSLDAYSSTRVTIKQSKQ